MVEERLRNFLLGGSERSVKAKKNIAAMIFIKGGNILVGLLLVPLTLHYVSSETYGIWLAISSMVAWFSFFDIGINNGLKNRLAEALAREDIPLAKRYVSTTYALLILIFIPLMVILLVVAPMLDWYSILNLQQEAVSGLLASVCIVITYFCINFILSTVNVVMTADQRPADAAFRTLVQQVLTLAVIYILTLTTKGSLVNLCLALCACPIIVVGVFNLTLFFGRYKRIAPSLRDVDFSTAPDLFKLGIQFFIIQIAGVIQYQMTNFLIIRYFGATEVTEYNIAYKYFNIPYMFWMTMLTPVWAAVTDAIAKNDYPWVKGAVKKYLLLFLVFLAGTLLMLVLSQPLYRLWVGDSVIVPFQVSLWVMVFNLAMMFGSIFVNVLNGAGILRVQAIACIISPFVFLGFCFLFIRMGWGVKSILIASILANFNGLLFAPVQCWNLLRKR
ncbi:MAG: oligosaccharide flippase family protein [Bacteroidales bacterium]|nr:oligosaccharide flippase family protein [Bacteroidales bacterium]